MIYALNHNANFNPSQLVGKPAPHFIAPLASGGNIDATQEYQKKLWTVVNFWSSTCYICRNEARELEVFYQTSRNQQPQQMQLISINVQDDVTSVQTWQKKYSQTFPVILDQNGLISIDFGITGTPETFFIDPNGIVRFRVAGEINQKIILNFIPWLSQHSDETQSELAKGFSKIASMN